MLSSRWPHVTLIDVCGDWETHRHALVSSSDSVNSFYDYSVCLTYWPETWLLLLSGQQSSTPSFRNIVFVSFRRNGKWWIRDVQPHMLLHVVLMCNVDVKCSCLFSTIPVNKKVDKDHTTIIKNDYYLIILLFNYRVSGPPRCLQNETVIKKYPFEFEKYSPSLQHMFMYVLYVLYA